MLREAGMEIGTRPSTPEVLAARLEIRPVPPDREHRPGVTSGSDIGYERTTQQNGPERSTSGGVVQRSSVGVGIPIGGSGDPGSQKAEAEKATAAPLKPSSRKKPCRKSARGSPLPAICISPCLKRKRAVMSLSIWWATKR